jgi:hypothetical protein
MNKGDMYCIVGIKRVNFYKSFHLTCHLLLVGLFCRGVLVVQLHGASDFGAQNFEKANAKIKSEFSK